MSADHPSQQTNGRSLDNILSKQQSTSEDQQFLHSIYDAIEASIFVVDVTEDVNFRYVAFNPAHERWTGICSEYVRGKTPEQVFSPTNAAVMRRHYNDCVRYGKTISYEECLRFQGIPSWWLTTLTPQQDSHGRIYRLIGTSTNINEQKQAEEALRLQVEREHLLGAFAPCAAPCWSIALHIRQSLDLDTILKRTVTEVRQFLQTSRVLIYRFKPDWSGVMAVESVVAPWLSVLGTNIQDPCFTEKHIERYRRGRIQVIEDIYVSGLHPCHIDLLASFQVRANLVVPIVSEQQLWGLLIAQHCQEPRQWQQVEVELLKQLGMQVGIAVQHAQLHHQVQCLNTDLESKVQQRTTQLQQALKFEALVRRITEKIRDSLDERQILQTVTRELAQALNIDRCKIDFFDTHYTTATTAYEYTTKSVVCQGLTKRIAKFPEFYRQLFERQPLQFFEPVPVLNTRLSKVTRLACPIFDDQGILGNLWLFRPKEEAFDEFEIQLVQQIANECAIAIRQARLYEATQVQVREREKLDCLKNEFLNTLSHELRTPITSISLAAQTLEAVLKQEGIFSRERPRMTQLFEILHSECQREIKLINDLLTLAHLDAEVIPPIMDTINLKTWIPSTVWLFEERIRNSRQQLYILTTGELPLLTTDISDLERILVELLTNACKYTPAGEMIIVSAYATANMIELSVSNSGVEIASDERTRIFDAFYRIPNNDPWQHGGTGLGLALVQKLVKRLGASIQVESVAGQTTFTVQFPRRDIIKDTAHFSSRERVVFLPGTPT